MKKEKENISMAAEKKMSDRKLKKKNLYITTRTFIYLCIISLCYTFIYKLQTVWEDFLTRKKNKFYKKRRTNIK